ncbi:hypothetical protein ACJVC5_14470 [Peredibacter sp. HCB2-198]|uniref:hypothetical protein n=1 Tax=Peredibacter sp. HCB2-198 TaxID=3383025 RepID=UPI0038B6725A
MDMKKKLEEAYIPDKQSQKEKVIIGLSGGIDSYVTAYLLKIQKYDLIAVTVINDWEDWKGDSSQILSCHINPKKLDEIKEFCQKLSIPLQVVKASGEFKNEIIDEWMASRLSGTLARPCWNCHELRMRVLHQKMKEANVKHLATGHFAKLFHQDATGKVFVHTSNDEENDQSALLSRLPQEILKDLILPLSDLTQKEVLKLAENFGVVEVPKTLKMHQCLSWKEEMTPIFTSLIPERLRKEGEIMTADGSSTIGNHFGVFHHTLGESFEYRNVGKTTKGYIGEYTSGNALIKVEEESYFLRDKILLTNCEFSAETIWTEPQKGCLVVSPDKVYECWVHPKTLSSAYIELTKPEFLIEGDLLSVIKKKGKNSKVFLTGKVQYLPRDPEVVEGEESVPKVDYSRDF